jgi:Uma2 family endonuclease
MPVVPDLAVEISSRTERGPQIAREVALSLEAGVAAVWILEPRSRTVVTHGPGASPVVLDQDATLSGGPLLRGFRVAVADLFAEGRWYPRGRVPGVGESRQGRGG